MRVSFFTFIAAVCLLMANHVVYAQNHVSVPADYPKSETVIADIKKNADIKNGLNALGLGFGKGETITLADYVPDRVDIPSAWEANSCIFKASIDYPKTSDNTFKRVFVALKYSRTVTINSAGPWGESGCVPNLCWFDEAHIIDANGTDLTHQKRVEEQKQKDLAEQQARQEKMKGANPADTDAMITLVKDGTKAKPSKFFGTPTLVGIKNIEVVIPENNKYMGKGNICTFLCTVNYEQLGKKMSKNFKIQGTRSNENEPFKFMNAYEQ